MLGLILSAARLLGIREALRAALLRLAATAALLLTAMGCLAAAAGFGLFAAYAWLATILPAPVAAGICAGVLLFASAVAVAAALWRPKRAAPRPQSAAAGLPPEAAGLMEWGRANPLEAAAAALVVGFLAGRRRR